MVFQSHNWPHWGTELIHDYMVNTASVYKYINDQTLMYINQGYTSDEISNMIELPEELEKIPRQAIFAIISKDKESQDKFIEIDGSRDVIEKLTQNMAEIPDFFNIVEP